MLHAPTCIFWLNISKQIMQMVEKCDVCQKYQNQQLREALSPAMPTQPWHTLTTDIYGFKGKSYLIVIDRYSKFIMIRLMLSHTTKETISKMLSIFSKFGMLKELHCDQGSNYTTDMFVNFMKNLDIMLTFSSTIIIVLTQQSKNSRL